MIHAYLKTSNLLKPQNMTTTKLRNVYGSVCSRDRPSAVQKMERYNGVNPNQTAPWDLSQAQKNDWPLQQLAGRKHSLTMG